MHGLCDALFVVFKQDAILLLFRTVDTDVRVLMISQSSFMNEISIEYSQRWVAIQSRSKFMM